MKGVKIFFLAIVGWLPFLLNAKINIGIEVMPQLTNRLSWATGINVEIPVTGQVYLSPGVFYSTRHRYDESLWQTYEYHPDGDIPTDYEKATMNIHGDYINVPFLIGFKSANNSTYNIKVAGGIYYAYCLGGKSKLRMDNNGDVSHMRLPSYETVIGKRGDFGLCLEVKYLLHSHYQIGLNLQHGLREIYKTHDVQGIKDTTMFHELNPGVRFHQSIGLSLGYIF